MRRSEECRNNNNNSDNPLTSRRTNGGKNWEWLLQLMLKNIALKHDSLTPQ